MRAFFASLALGALAQESKSSEKYDDSLSGRLKLQRTGKGKVSEKKIGTKKKIV